MSLIPLPNAYAKGASLMFNASRLVNFYAVPAAANEQARSAFFLRGTPGKKLFYDTFNRTGIQGAVRGMIRVNDRLFVVVGNGLLDIADNGNAAIRSTSAITGVAPVSMSTSGEQVLIVSDTASYVYTISSLTLQTVTDPDFPLADTTTWQNGYFIVNKRGSKQFHVSGLYNALAWAALDFASAESDPDNILTVFAAYNDLWIFGEQTTEIWRNTGNATFPYEKLQGVAIDVGIGAKLSAAKGDNSVFWLGSDKIVYRAAGYSPVVISTPAIAEVIEELASIEDAEGYTYRQSNSTFYVLTFPSGGRTFVYDTATQVWHERSTQAGGVPRAWDARYGVAAFGRTFVGGANGVIYTIDLKTYDDAGREILRTIDLPVLHAGTQNLVLDRLEVLLDAGRGGFAAFSDVEPLVTIAASEDSCATFETQAQVNAGQVGQYKARVVVGNLGQYPLGATLRLTMSSKTQWNVIAADAMIEGREA